jgi:hypothetical protein
MLNTREILCLNKRVNILKKYPLHFRGNIVDRLEIG